MDKLLKVRKYIKDNKMIEKNDSVILGVSGGADSVCLYKMLLDLKDEYNLNMLVVHVHHGIRGEEADRDLDFVRKMCDKDGIFFELIRENVPEFAKKMGMSEEEAGRTVRYRAFGKIADKIYNEGKNVKIAIAHNLNDNVETFIHNLCRGTGINGLAGIRAVSDKIIRPIMCLTRQEIEEYLCDNKFDFVNDSTNFAEEYTRNKIRNTVIPYLTENINEESVSHINNAALELRMVTECLNRQCDRLYEKVAGEQYDKIYIDLSQLEGEDEYIISMVIRRAIGQTAGRLKDISRIHINDVMELIHKQSGKYITLPYNIIARREYNKIVLGIACDQVSRMEEEIFIDGPGDYLFGGYHFDVQILDVEKSKININSYEESLKNNQKMYTKCFDYDKINFTVCLRYRQTGDFLVVNSNGNKKKLKAYFVDEKVASGERNTIPLLCDGGHVMWVVGHRISEEYKVTSGTKRILVINRKEKE